MDPKPRPRPIPIQPLQWPVQRHLNAPLIPAEIVASFREVLLNRRSERRLRPARLRYLAAAIALATRSHFIASGAPLSRYKRPAPSAGALHPFRVVIVPLNGAPRSFLCDPDGDRLSMLYVRRPEPLRALRGRVREMLPEARGALVVLIGDPRMTDAYYEEPQPLFWRDAGALLQTLLLTLEAYGLAACAGGLSGDDILRALELETRAVAGGLLIAGRSVRTD